MSRQAIVLGGNTVSSSSGGGGDATDIYYFQDLDDGSTLYIGKSKTDGTWQISKMTGSADLNMAYASLTNNPTRTTYALAWTNRATLTYGDISTT